MNWKSTAGFAGIGCRNLGPRPKMTIRKTALILLGLIAVAPLAAGCVQSPSATSSTPADSYKISRTETVPPFYVHLLPGGTEMELAGGMPYGTTDAVRQILDTTPRIQVIHLNSSGGEAHEGYELALLIKERHLVTYTSTTCASACTLAFIAGKQRYLGQNAWLGFHSASRTMGGDSWALANEGMRNIYREDGLPENFIDKALGTAPSEIWYPSHDELTAAHVVDQFVDEKRFAKSGLAYWQSASDLDAAMKANAFYAAIAAHDAANYAQLKDIYLRDAKVGRSAADTEDEAAKFAVARILPTYIDKSPDEPLLAYQRLQLAQLKFLAAHNPASCAATAFPKLGLSAPDIEHVLPMSLLTDEINSLAVVAQAALTHPRISGNAAAEHRTLTDFYRHLMTSSPQTVALIRKPTESSGDPARLCNAVVDFFQSILDLPPEQAAIVGREIMGTHS